MILKFLHFEGNRIDFLKRRNLFFAISAAFMIFSIGTFITKGLNFGIDFKGGVLIETKLAPNISISDIRKKVDVLNLGNISIQEFGQKDVVLMRVQKQAGGATAQQQGIAQIKEALGDDVIEYRRTESVGPTFSSDLRKSAILAIILTIIGIFVYIWFRFEWQFGAGAVLALLHDVITTIGLFALFQIEVSLATVAAVLTIAGYSINDTVVIYDRVRENIRKYKNLPLTEVYNLSLNQTLSRSILTSVTTLLALIALALFGGAVVRDFVVPLIWGVVFGTYSSIGFAVPFIHYFPPHRDET